MTSGECGDFCLIDFEEGGRIALGQFFVCDDIGDLSGQFCLSQCLGRIRKTEIFEYVSAAFLDVDSFFHETVFFGQYYAISGIMTQVLENEPSSLIFLNLFIENADDFYVVCVGEDVYCG